jgi:hypothetical protein
MSGGDCELSPLSVVALLPLKMIIDMVNEFRTTRQVCRRWRTLIPEGRLTISSKVTDDALRSLEPLQHVQRLTMAQCARLTDDGAAQLTQCRSLVAIALTNNANVGLQTVMALCSLKTLRRVNLYMCTAINDAMVMHLCTLTQLERLILTGAKITNRSVAIIAQALPLMGDLELGHANEAEHALSITDSAVARLAGLEQLTSLILNGCAVTDRSVHNFSSLTNLLNLGLSHACGSRPISAGAITTLASHCTRLTHVSLNGAQIDASGVRSLCRAARALRALQLNNNLLLDDEAVAHACSLPKLELLWIGGMHNPTLLTDSAVRALGDVASTLEDLHLDCGTFSPNSVGYLSSLRQLTAITLEGTGLFLLPDDAAAWELVTLSFPALSHFQLMDTVISAAHMESIATRVTSIRCLHLHACDVSDEVARLLSRNEKLEHLELHGGAMEPGALGHFTRLTRLESLLLSDFDAVDADELEVLGNLSLTQLELHNTSVDDRDQVAHLAGTVTVFFH